MVAPFFFLAQLHLHTHLQKTKIKHAHLAFWQLSTMPPECAAFLWCGHPYSSLRSQTYSTLVGESIPMALGNSHTTLYFSTRGCQAMPPKALIPSEKCKRARGEEGQRESWPTGNPVDWLPPSLVGPWPDGLMGLRRSDWSNLVCCCISWLYPRSTSHT